MYGSYIIIPNLNSMPAMLVLKIIAQGLHMSEKKGGWHGGFAWNYRSSFLAHNCVLFFGHTAYGPEEWGNVANACRQSNQSPIDIVTKNVEADASLGELDITCDNDKGLFNGILLNNGHEPVLTIDKTRGICNLTAIPSLNNKVFQLHDLIIHFGCESDRGSEHTVDGKKFPAEVGRTLVLVIIDLSTLSCRLGFFLQSAL